MGVIRELPQLETERDGAVLTIRLANEKARNALSRDMRLSLREVIREIEDDRTIRAVYLTGKGAAFCAGGDLDLISKANDPWPVHRRFRHASNLFQSLTALDRPVVCGVRGHAIGGGLGVALMADLIVAGTSARFSAGFNRIGTVPDCMTLFALPRIVGLGVARAFLLTNGVWDAERAMQLGIAAEVVPDEDVDRRGLELAHQLAAGPAEVMGMSKLLLLKAFESSMDDLMLHEGMGQALAMSSVEFREGLAAVQERRTPDFLGAVLSHPLSDGLPGPDKP